MVTYTYLVYIYLVHREICGFTTTSFFHFVSGRPACACLIPFFLFRSVPLARLYFRFFFCAPAIYRVYVDPSGFDELAEGASRPGFFRGVATVVTKLLNVVQPDRAYFGQKDALQCVLVKRLVEVGRRGPVLQMYPDPKSLNNAKRRPNGKPETPTQMPRPPPAALLVFPSFPRPPPQHR